MSDTDGTKTAEPATGTPATGDVTQAEVDKWKALARKHEEQAKANKAELDKLVASGNASKSDAERMAAELAELKARADEADQRALRAEVAQEKGLSKWAAARLQGSTKEELEADADAYLAEHPAPDTGTGGETGTASTTRPTAGRPREQLRPASTPRGDTGTEQYDSAKFLADVPRG